MPLVIDLDNKSQAGRWYDYADGVSVLILPYRRSLVRKTLREAATTVERVMDGEKAMMPDTDPELWDRQLYRNLIKDLKGVVDTAGQPLAVTGELIDMLCDQVEGFAAWALEKSQELAQETAVKAEAEIKNSKGLRGGRHANPKD